MAAIQLNNVPPELYKHVLIMQGELKAKKGVGVYSQAQTVMQIIKEHKEMKEKKS